MRCRGCRRCSGATARRPIARSFRGPSPPRRASRRPASGSARRRHCRSWARGWRKSRSRPYRTPDRACPGGRNCARRALPTGALASRGSRRRIYDRIVAGAISWKYPSKSFLEECSRNCDLRGNLSSVARLIRNSHAALSRAGTGASDPPRICLDSGGLALDVRAPGAASRPGCRLPIPTRGAREGPSARILASTSGWYRCNAAIACATQS